MLINATVGHFSRDCPQGGGGDKRTCHTCGSEDHLARDCPDKKSQGNDFYSKGPDAGEGSVIPQSSLLPLRTLTIAISRAQPEREPVWFCW